MSDHVVLTGPIKGTVTLQDGTEIDVRPIEIFVDTLDEAEEVAHLIGERYAAEGHPSHDPGDEFVHIAHPKFASYKPHAANLTLHRKKA